MYTSLYYEIRISCSFRARYKKRILIQFYENNNVRSRIRGICFAEKSQTQFSEYIHSFLDCVGIHFSRATKFGNRNSRYQYCLFLSILKQLKVDGKKSIIFIHPRWKRILQWKITKAPIYNGEEMDFGKETRKIWTKIALKMDSKYLFIIII